MRYAGHRTAQEAQHSTAAHGWRNPHTRATTACEEEVSEGRVPSEAAVVVRVFSYLLRRVSQGVGTSVREMGGVVFD
jgi:hypothetical protein